MNCARNCGNLLNFVKVIPKTLLVPFFSGHGVYMSVCVLFVFAYYSYLLLFLFYTLPTVSLTFQNRPGPFPGRTS